MADARQSENLSTVPTTARRTGDQRRRPETLNAITCQLRSASGIIAQTARARANSTTCLGLEAALLAVAVGTDTASAVSRRQVD